MSGNRKERICYIQKLRLISGEFVGAGNYTNGSRTYYTLKGQK